ncbi:MULTISPECIES: MMPL family transporter [unclassified Leifsonia]|uniref:MMPL family transporter n=1 Tax=unclassified Leifsonia TaxID=2663824 RepID=UPI000700BCB8|nr:MULTISPECIES: MMPL family transporter [unclassified Leifsonia]KQX05057.1 RND transporter [Leifsonia sp. Root1293]KRA08689.1 RND transporter [Leifsonia sp. Root60]
MAELLYRLGRFAARRAWTVITAWVLVIVVAAVGFAVGYTGLSSSFDIPGTASGAVTDELQEKLPDFSGAAGTVVFETTDGSAFTDEQKSEITALATDAADLPDVAKVVDPFQTETERAAQEQQLADGRTQIADGTAQIDAGQTQLDAGQAQLDAGRAQLDAARQQAEAAGAPAEQIAALDAQQATLDAQQAEIDAQQDKLDASRTEIEAQTTKLDNGATLMELSKDIRVVSEDGSTALVNVAFTEPRLELSEDSKHAVIDHFESEPIDGVEVSFSTDIAQGTPSIVGVGEIVGVVFAAIVLLVMLGSVIAAALPLVTAIVGVAIGALGSLAFSGVVQMASVTPVLGLMLGLAVGIDYSLFIINRHRKQLLQGAEPHESVGLANGTAGNAVVFAGTTVIVALFALNITGVPFLGLMGTVGAISVAIAVLIATSLTPAMLGLLGTRILSRRARARIGEEHHEDTKAKPMKTWRAVVTVLATAAALLTIAIPALSMRVGLPDGSSEPVESASYQAFTTTEDQFGAGATGPLLVTAQLPSGLDDDEVLQTQVDVAQTLADQDDVVAVAPIAVSDDNRLAAFQVVPAEGPNSVSTEQLVIALRDLEPIDGDITLGVAGQAAINIDISANLAAVLPLYLGVVVGLSLLIMILVFRSILVPLIATGGFILSLFATFGAVVAVFQWGWGADALGIHTGPILSFLPVILTGILFGLAMDYQLFLASGMREAYVHGAPARLAVARGFRAGRAVVTAAGLIMVSVFGGFIFSESTMIRSIGFGLAFGVLVDAFVVRMLLMPALMHLLGDSAWWLPRWLDRILPNVDVEGAALERRHHAG